MAEGGAGVGADDPSSPPAAAPAPAAAPPAAAEPIREDQVVNAVSFLSHPKVRDAPVDERRRRQEAQGSLATADARRSRLSTLLGQRHKPYRSKRPRSRPSAPSSSARASRRPKSTQRLRAPLRHPPPPPPPPPVTRHQQHQHRHQHRRATWRAGPTPHPNRRRRLTPSSTNSSTSPTTATPPRPCRRRPRPHRPHHPQSPSAGRRSCWARAWPPGPRTPSTAP
jgi:hypothetical protein